MKMLEMHLTDANATPWAIPVSQVSIIQQGPIQGTIILPIGGTSVLVKEDYDKVLAQMKEG